MDWMNDILSDWLLLLIVCVVLIWLVSATSKPENCKWATSCILIAYFGFLVAYFTYAWFVAMAYLEFLKRLLEGLQGLS